MRFYLGTHEVPWLRDPRFVGVPLCYSLHRFARLRHWLEAMRGMRMLLDLGGFTTLLTHGGWKFTARQGALKVRTLMHCLGDDVVEHVATMDWMCEPIMLKRTGLSIAEHQRRSVASYLDLMSIAPGVPWVPTLQGWEAADYLRCAEMYDAAGVDLASLPLVGVGSVCRRQGTPELVEVLSQFQGMGIKLHGWGVKERGLTRLLSEHGGGLASSDSLAWSMRARYGRIRMPGCTHNTCANCPTYALHWRRRLLSRLAQATPPPVHRLAA